MSERNGHTFIPLEFEHLSAEEQLLRAHEFELRCACVAPYDSFRRGKSLANSSRPL